MLLYTGVKAQFWWYKEINWNENLSVVTSVKKREDYKIGENKIIILTNISKWMKMLLLQTKIFDVRLHEKW